MNYEEKRDAKDTEEYVALLIHNTGINTCKDFETMLDLSEKDNYDRHSCFESGGDSLNVEFDLIESEHGWEFSGEFEVRIGGEYEGIISAGKLDELLQERYV
ncbi:MAG: hypothetical protein GQ474_05970 [Sulfurimonas sp.]|nr:hypothetical protein [Sulfurimonas sp.]